MKIIVWTIRLLLLFWFPAPALIAQEVVDQTNPPTNPSGLELPGESELITESQRRLADRYQLLEDKLLTLYEYERDANPLRSRVLKRAFQQSQEKMTTLQFRTIIQLLQTDNLKGAEASQELVLSQLKSLLNLLESEDRGKRVRDELKRHQEYLREVERLFRMQRGIRGQTEGGSDPIRLAMSQQKTAQRTKKLAGDIKSNEESESSQSRADPSSQDDLESTPGEGAGGQAQEGQGQSGQGQSGQSSDGSPPAPQQAKMNPVRQRVEAALDRMRKAQEKLENANRTESIGDMRVAENELEAARKGLEEILRQLREEDIGRMLARLESRFRQMLERQLRVYEDTRKLDSTPVETRTTEFEIRAGKISVAQKLIGAEASRALLLLREDGSSVAFPETVEQLHTDMLQVAQRLSAAKTGKITIEIEEDIIETLQYLVAALEISQQDLESMKTPKPGQQSGGKPGEKPLVDGLAEIKMLRGLQDRIYRRHLRYSKLLKNPDDPIGSTQDPDLQRALERLGRRQQQLTDIAHDIVVGKNK